MIRTTIIQLRRIRYYTSQSLCNVISTIAYSCISEFTAIISSINGHLGLFIVFSFFSNNSLQKKTVSFSRVWTQIVGVEGEHADHKTTTTALRRQYQNIEWTVLNDKEWTQFRVPFRCLKGVFLMSQPPKWIENWRSTFLRSQNESPFQNLYFKSFSLKKPT